MVILGALAQPSGLAGHLCRTWQACIAGFAGSDLQALDISTIQKCKKGMQGLNFRILCCIHELRCRKASLQQLSRRL